MQNLKLRFTAVFFILALIPKIGLELYAHQLLHQSKNFNETSHNTSSQLNVKCHCFDDVSMPLAEAVLIQIPVPEKESNISFPQHVNSFSFLSKDFSLLRGPPVV